MRRRNDTRYSVIDLKTGSVVGRGLTVRAAAEKMLGNGKAAFEVVSDPAGDDRWNLLRSPDQASGEQAPTRLRPTGHFVMAATQDDAWDQIAEMVVNGHWSIDHDAGLEAMTDDALCEAQRVVPVGWRP